MYILMEKRKLDEMAIQIVSVPKDGLPFKVTIQSPDKGKFDHAHIYPLGKSGKELGTFVITETPPKTVLDLVPYTEGPHKGLKGMSKEHLQALVDWADKKHSAFPGTNWEALQYMYWVNRNS